MSITAPHMSFVELFSCGYPFGHLVISSDTYYQVQPCYLCQNDALCRITVSGRVLDICNGCVCVLRRRLDAADGLTKDQNAARSIFIKREIIMFGPRIVDRRVSDRHLMCWWCQLHNHNQLLFGTAHKWVFTLCWGCVSVSGQIINETKTKERSKLCHAAVILEHRGLPQDVIRLITAIYWWDLTNIPQLAAESIME